MLTAFGHFCTSDTTSGLAEWAKATDVKLHGDVSPRPEGAEVGGVRGAEVHADHEAFTGARSGHLPLDR